MSKKVAGILFLVFGLVILLAGVISTAVILSVAPSSLKNAAVLKTPGQDKYDEWIDTRSKNAPGLFYEYMVYNITNIDVLAQDLTSAPEVEEVGPYVYREYCRKNDVSFSPNNAEVTYKEYCWKEFVPEKSVNKEGKQLKDSDIITNLYFPLYTVLSKQGPATLQNPSAFYYTAFMQAVAKQVSTVATALKVSPTDLFFANQSIIAGAVEQASGLKLNYIPEFGSIENNFELTTPTPNGPVQVPVDMPVVVDAMKNMNTDNLMSRFFQAGLTTTTTAQGDVPTIVAFLMTAQKYQVAMNTPNTPEETKDTLVATLHHIIGTSPDKTNPYTPMIIAAMANYVTTGAAKYFGYAFAQQHAYLGNDPRLAYDLTANHFFTQREARKLLVSESVDPFVERLGLHTAASLFPNLDCPAYYQKNQNSENNQNFDVEACNKEFKTYSPTASDTYAQKTGRINIEDVEKFTEYRSSNILPKRDAEARTGYWQKEVPVRGRKNPNTAPANSDMIQWRMNPHIHKGYKLHIFNPDTFRDVYLTYEKDASVEGVDTMVFALDKVNYDPELADPVFEIDQYGIFNLTTPKGAPVFLTLPHFKEASYLTTQKNNVVMPVGVREPIHEEDSIYLYVEPLTGKTIKALFKLQVNFEVVAGVPGLTSYVPSGKRLVMPMVYMNKHSQATPSDIDNLKSVQTALNKVPRPVLIVGCTVGPVFMAIGILLICLGKKKEEEMGRHVEMSPVSSP